MLLELNQITRVYQRGVEEGKALTQKYLEGL